MRVQTHLAALWSSVHGKFERIDTKEFQSCRRLEDTACIRAKARIERGGRGRYRVPECVRL